MISIALDVLGGDLPDEVRIKGALSALDAEKELFIWFVGNESIILDYINKLRFPFSKRWKIIHNTNNFGMGETPSKILKEKKYSSLSVATSLVKSNDCSGLVSAGNTGAQMATSLFQLGRIAGIDRPGIAISIPTSIGFTILIDAGANTDIKSKNLVDFSIMGQAYSKTIYKTNKPSVALINNGSEEEKGNLLNKESFPILQKEVDNFIGYIEGRDIMSGKVDVIICDGFTGNIILKTIEGTALSILKTLKYEIDHSIIKKIGASFLKSTLSALKKKLDYRNYGGAPLLGINGVSIICHGSSDEVAIKNALLQAFEMVKNKTIESISSFQ